MKRFLNTAKLTALLAVLLVGALAVGCGNGGGTTPEPLVGVTISGEGITRVVLGAEYTLTLLEGATVELTAAPEPGSAVVTSWAWVSYDDEIASIDGTGNVIEVYGEVVDETEIRVTATGPGGTHTTLINVSVIPPPLVTAVTVSGAGIAGSAGEYTLTMVVGGNVTLTATPVPGNAPVTWSWTTAAVGTANITAGAATASGTISAVALGETAITVTAAGAEASTASATITVNVIPPPLDAPGNLLFARDPTRDFNPWTETRENNLMGISWSRVTGSVEYNIFVFTNEDESDPNNAAFYRLDVEPTFNPLAEFTQIDLSGGPYWFRVQAVGDGAANSNSLLSEPMGPFWHSTAFTQNREVEWIVERLNNSAIPVLVLDVRRADERYVTPDTAGVNPTYGRVVGDFHVVWPGHNADTAYDRDGATAATFQDGVLAAWQKVVEDLTPEQEAWLTLEERGHRDIYVFVYCAGGVRSLPGSRVMATLGFTNVYEIGGFTGGVSNLRTNLPEHLRELNPNRP